MDKISAQSSDAFSTGFPAHSKHLAMHRDSHAISKLKPKIRIIHLTAPKVIKTDVENFRDLVQRLTGKSDEVKTRTKKACTVAAKGIISSTNCPKLWKNTHPQDHQGCHVLQGKRRIKEETQCLYEGSDGSHGTFGGSGDIGINFLQDLSEFHRLPSRSSQSQFKNMMFSEMPLC